MVTSAAGLLTVLVGVAALFFWLQERTGWRVFRFLPPLIWIYALPVALNNLGVIPSASPVYLALRDLALPSFIILMLLQVDVGGAVRVMGKGVLVMLLGTAGVVVGGVAAYALVHTKLSADAWTGFGALAGSWIGGTGNMAAVAAAVDAPAEQLGLAVLADNAVYIVWLPLLLGSKAFAERFNRWARVPEERLARMEAAAAAEVKVEERVAMRHYLYLAAVALAGTWAAAELAPRLPEVGVVLETSTWRILLVTTFGIALSFTPVRRIPGSHEVAMALVYVFVASMGARAALGALGQAPYFLLGAFVWIAIHGAFCLLGARLFRVDLHSVAIASAANVGGAASAPVVAAAHRESLVPAAILMALIGYALGNYLALVTAHLCRWVGGG
jgi:uncharacterized membrane protein